MKAVLLRDPEEIVCSYRRAHDRGERAYSENMSRLFSGCNTERAWLDRAEENGLLGELWRFHEGWLADSSEKLTIHYRDVVQKPKQVVNRIEAYFGLPQSKSVVLLKRRYTRSPIRNLQRKARTRVWTYLRGLGLD